VCLGLEVACCFANSVVSTRYLIQDSMVVQNTECDNCLVGFLVAMEQLACSTHPLCVHTVRAFVRSFVSESDAHLGLICARSAVFRCAGELSGNPALEEAGALLTVGADLTYCSVCSCMQTQHKMQLDARDEGRYVTPAFMAVPGAQGMDGYGAVPTPQAGFYPAPVAQPQGYPASYQ
jgi:hypothetical protein